MKYVDTDFLSLLLEYKRFEDVATLVSHSADILRLHSELLHHAAESGAKHGKPSKLLRKLTHSAEKYIRKHHSFIRYITETLSIIDETSDSLDLAMSEALRLRAELVKDITALTR